jgi:hypothetical protein
MTGALRDALLQGRTSRASSSPLAVRGTNHPVVHCNNERSDASKSHLQKLTAKVGRHTA